MSETERYLTVRDIAERLQLSEHTILRALRGGDLRGARFGRSGGWRVAPSELDRWIASRTPGRKASGSEREG